MVSEDILAELMADPMTKIIGESGQGGIGTPESELAAKAAKIKTTDDMIEKDQKHGFLVVLGRAKYSTVIGNWTVQWTSPEDSGSSNKTIWPKNSSFYHSKGKKKHAQRVIEYKTFLGVEESIQILILQVVEETYLIALKEEYIGYSRQMPFEMIKYLRTKISKVINMDKVQLNK